MQVCDITDYLIELERTGFTGSITLNFHKGDISTKIDKRISENIKDPIKI